MADPAHLAILNNGVEAWNKWRHENPTVMPDLSGLNFFDLKLYEGGSFTVTNRTISGANFSRTILVFTNFAFCRLSNVNFCEADLSYARFYLAQLHDCDCRGAIFSHADLSGGDFTNANFTTAKMGETTIGFNNLSEVVGLDNVLHSGPSYIGIDTFYRSEGNIPEVFLRGCGVPESFIVQIPALVAAIQPIQFYSCFISYSSKDEGLARRLHADLQAKGVRCWFAPEELKIGERFRQRIDEVVRVHDKLLLILSEHSVASSWVEKEVETAMESEDEQGKPILFPMRLDDSVMEVKTGWPADVRRTRHIGDFRRWKEHDEYQKAFARLLADLKASA